MLLRLALALVAECEADLLQLADFEDVITFLKARAHAAYLGTPTGCACLQRCAAHVAHAVACAVPGHDPASILEADNLFNPGA